MPETALQGCPTCVFSRGVMIWLPVALHGKEMGRSKLRTAADVRNDGAADVDKYSEK